MGTIIACILHLYNSRNDIDIMDLDETIKRMVSVLFCSGLLLVLYRQKRMGNQI